MNSKVQTCEHRHGRCYVEKGKAANFFVYYEFDEDESKHLLALEEYGCRDAPNAWVLLWSSELHLYVCRARVLSIHSQVLAATLSSLRFLAEQSKRQPEVLNTGRFLTPVRHCPLSSISAHGSSVVPNRPGHPFEERPLGAS